MQAEMSAKRGFNELSVCGLVCLPLASHLPPTSSDTRTQALLLDTVPLVCAMHSFLTPAPANTPPFWFFIHDCDSPYLLQ